MATHILFESASGYAIFQVNMTEVVGAKTKEVQDSIQDLHRFGKMVSLKSFDAFKSAAHALENINDVSEGVLNDHLKALLELNLSKSSKKSPVTLGVSEKGLAGSIVAELGIPCDTSELSLELIRGVRMHAEKLLKGLQEGDVVKAQLGLGHSYSRAKIKFNVNRSDNMIIQAIALLDQLDKDVNTFSMRVREWYGWHFPELAKIVTDNYQFAKAARLIGPKNTFSEEKLEALTEILDDDETKAKNVLDAARTSMGTDLSELDAINILNFAQRVVELAEYRKSLTSYLSEKMNLVAPSLTALIGERIGARLISHAGSLTNLSKYPASTVQILGAEKALFRALKTKGNTPKYGLIFHSSFIGKAGPKHKGRISRFLANKCSIASRIDCFSDTPTAKFGDALRHQVEERLNFFETGAAPSKNSDAMKKVLDALALEDDEDDEEMESAPVVQPSKPKKRTHDEMDVDEPELDKKAAKRKAKEEKKRAKEERRLKRVSAVSAPAASDVEEVSPKKSKKEKKSKEERESKKRRKSKAGD